MYKIGVVIIARNEETHIRKTIIALQNQTLKPYQIVVIDDRSKDDTAKIVSSMGVDVVTFPYDHDNWVIKKELALVFNLGLENLDRDLDFVSVVGADDILPENYFQCITQKMIHEDITIASGGIGGEQNIIPRGSGRLVDWSWWKSVGGIYPINYGYESWLLAKCKTQGRDYKVYPEIKSIIQRPTGTNYKTKKYIHRGQAFKALGYNRRFVFGRFIVMILKKRQPLEAVRLMYGFIVGPEELYEDDVRQYFKKIHNSEMSIKKTKSHLLRFFRG